MIADCYASVTRVSCAWLLTTVLKLQDRLSSTLPRTACCHTFDEGMILLPGHTRLTSVARSSDIEVRYDRFLVTSVRCNLVPVVEMLL
jgi:hypothetical protein